MIFELNEHKQAFLKALLERGGEYSLAPHDDVFRDKWGEEIRGFNRLRLLEHSNPDAYNTYCQFGLSEKGKQAAAQYCPIEA